MQSFEDAFQELLLDSKFRGSPMIEA